MQKTKIKINHLNHVTIAAPPEEHEKVEWFYETILGLKKLPLPEKLAEAYDVWWYELGDARLHVDFSPPFMKTPFNRHFCIEVDDIKAVRKLFEENNVKIIEDVEIPYGMRFHCEDPFGNDIEILELYDKSK